MSLQSFKEFFAQVDKFWWEFVLTLAGYNLFIGGLLYFALECFK